MEENKRKRVTLQALRDGEFKELVEEQENILDEMGIGQIETADELFRLLLKLTIDEVKLSKTMVFAIERRLYSSSLLGILRAYSKRINAFWEKYKGQPICYTKKETNLKIDASVRIYKEKIKCLKIELYNVRRERTTIPKLIMRRVKGMIYKRDPIFLGEYKLTTAKGINQFLDTCDCVGYELKEDYALTYCEMNGLDFEDYHLFDQMVREHIDVYEE